MRTGDHVRHEPSGEEWLVAYVEDGRLAPIGWPLAFVPVESCTLLARATREEYTHWLHEMAKASADDPRARYAKRMLAQPEVIR